MAAAGLKAHALATGPVAARGVAFWFGLLLVGAELLFALWLASNLWPVLARRATLALLAAFAGVSLYRLLDGQATCGCFGRVSVHPAWTLALDIALFAVLRCSQPCSAARAFCPSAALVEAGFMLVPMSVALLLAGPLRPILRQALTASSPNTVVVDSESWRGHPFPLLDYVLDSSARADLATGERVVILYDRHCKTCQDQLARLSMSGNERGISSRIYIMDISSPSGKELPPLRFAGLTQVELRPDVMYVADVPVELTLRAGVVQAMSTAKQ